MEQEGEVEMTGDILPLFYMLISLTYSDAPKTTQSKKGQTGEDKMEVDEIA